MGRRVNVIGVGNDEVRQAWAERGLPRDGEQGGAGGPAGREDPLRRGQQAYAGYVYGDSTCGQRAIYEVGLTGIPVFNVNNNCSTGSTALMLGKQAVEGGLVECVLVVGFEKMEKGALGSKFTDRESPVGKHAQVMIDVQGFSQAPPDGADVRRRGARVPLEVRREEGDLRADQREGAQARGEQPVRDLQPAR